MASDFDQEMAALGVKPLAADAERIAGYEVPEPPEEVDELSDDELFLASLGKLDSRFQDDIPDSSTLAEPRRMKQLRQGKIKPEAQFDLHGMLCEEAVTRVGHFLENARFHQLRCVLVITGRGQHSANGPVLRDAIEAYLSGPGQGLVAEWARAPRRFGGDGALVVFLRQV